MIKEAQKTTKLLTVAEAASRQGVTPKTVRTWIRKGYLAAFRVGVHTVIRRADVDSVRGRIPPPGRPRSRKAS